MEFDVKSKECVLCSYSGADVSATLGLCANCIRVDLDQANPVIAEVHRQSRQAFGLPTRPTGSEGGRECVLCGNACAIPEGGSGFCGLRTVKAGRLMHSAGTPERGLLRWYRDPLPTNCVADWVCEGSHNRGMHNLAVFYESCTLNCLCCQNWHFRRTDRRADRGVSARELAASANRRTFCACFFGGDPSSQMAHSLASAKEFADRGVRTCWETNGMMHHKLLDAALGYASRTGGCIKFDLKAHDAGIHRALTGASNTQVLQNFQRAASQFEATRPGGPLIIASTLLIPGYVDVEEVTALAGFIAEINPQIPFTLLAFAPSFYFGDLPCTSSQHARQARMAAEEAGLTNVRLANRHLLDLGW